MPARPLAGFQCAVLKLDVAIGFPALACRGCVPGAAVIDAGCVLGRVIREISCRMPLVQGLVPALVPGARRRVCAMTTQTTLEPRPRTGETRPPARGLPLQLRLFEDLHAVVPEFDHPRRLQGPDEQVEVPTEDRQELVVADVAGRDDQQPPRRRPEPVAVPKSRRPW